MLPVKTLLAASLALTAGYEGSVLFALISTSARLVTTTASMPTAKTVSAVTLVTAWIIQGRPKLC